MPQNPSIHIEVDREGFLISQGIRWDDVEFCSALIKEFNRQENGLLICRHQNREIPVLYFEAPLMAREIKHFGNQLESVLIYQIKTAYDLIFYAPVKFMYLDSFERLKGRCFPDFETAQSSLSSDQTVVITLLKKSLPFTCLSMAQSEFFLKNQSWPELKHFPEEINPYPWTPQILPQIQNLDLALHCDQSESWQRYYDQEKTLGWDQGMCSPSLVSLIKNLGQHIKSENALVIGAGQGYDYVFLKNSQLFSSVKALDFVAFDTLLKNSKVLKEHDRQSIVQLDVLNLSEKYPGQFNFIWEYTCYCALHPKNRAAYWKSLHAALSEKGILAGTFLMGDTLSGPPFSTTALEVKLFIEPYFDILAWYWETESLAARQFKELSILLRKK